MLGERRRSALLDMKRVSLGLGEIARGTSDGDAEARSDRGGRRALAERDRRVRALMLKGSLARGDADERSDVDFVVVARPGRLEELWAARHSIAEGLCVWLGGTQPMSRVPASVSLKHVSTLRRSLISIESNRAVRDPA